MRFKGARERIQLPFMGLYGDAPGVDNPGDVEHAVWLWRMCEMDDFVDNTEDGGLLLRRGLRLEQKTGVTIVGVKEHPETERVKHRAFAIVFNERGEPEPMMNKLIPEQKAPVYPDIPIERVSGLGNLDDYWHIGPSDMAAFVTSVKGAAATSKWLKIGRHPARTFWPRIEGPGEMAGVFVRDVA